MEIMPLVEQGRVILFPDPCNFDFHLRDQMFAMAKFRCQRLKVDPKEEGNLFELMKEDHKRGILMLPRRALRQLILRTSPELDATEVEDNLNAFDLLRERDPLAAMQDASLEGGAGGQFMPFKMAPNFEITMYLAQATGSCVVTDSVFRWRELVTSASRGIQKTPPLIQLKHTIEQAGFVFPQDIHVIGALAEHGVFQGYPVIARKIFKYLSTLSSKGIRPNVEASLNAEFKRVHASTVPVAKRFGAELSNGQISCLWPADGIQDNAVNRLLLMSNSEHHLESAPLALFIKSNIPER